jgi:hypothetical protein
MSEENKTYRQPVKRKIRETVLRHGVESLTRKRESSPLVTIDKFDLLTDYCIRQFALAKKDIREPMAIINAQWKAVHASRVGQRAPSDLKVLFLCGPEPLNDLTELTDLGIPAENVWAIEGDRRAHRAAADQLQKAGIPIKLHLGSLHEFLTVVPEQFDIVYFDACGPLFGGTPKTSFVMRELFLNQRLAPLSVLITNFAAKPRDKEEVWVKRLYSWYAPRYIQPVLGKIDGAMEFERIYEGLDSVYGRHVRKYLEKYYSDFVTRFTIEFIGELLPWWRVRALPSAKRTYFAGDKELAAAVESALGETETSSGHCMLSPSDYQLLWAGVLMKRHLEDDDDLLELYTKDRLRQSSLCDAVNAVSLVRNYIESVTGWGKPNSDACSAELREALEEFHWFDSEGMELERLFCDSPLPNLVVDLLVGVYGYPYHVNLAKLKRMEYTAKETPMYIDVFVLDQCRYMYDLVPTLSMFGDHLPVDRQLQIRMCMNLIRLHTEGACWDLFHASALARAEIRDFPLYSWPERKVIR